jgi:hypothetical protein
MIFLFDARPPFHRAPLANCARTENIARGGIMNVRELIKALQTLPDQEATVVIGEGQKPEVWLIVSGVIERSIQVSENDLDWAGPGDDPAVEIV